MNVEFSNCSDSIEEQQFNLFSQRYLLCKMFVYNETNVFINVIQARTHSILGNQRYYEKASTSINSKLMQRLSKPGIEWTAFYKEYKVKQIKNTVKDKVDKIL